MVPHPTARLSRSRDAGAAPRRPATALLALLALLALVLPGACRQPEPPPPPAPLRALEPRQLASLGTAVRCGALHPSGLVAAGTEAGSVLVAGTGAPRVFGGPRFHQGPVVGLQFSSDGKHLLSAGGRRAVWWVTESGSVEREVQGPQRITAALLREPPGGATAYFGTAMGAMVSWSVKDKGARPLRELACAAMQVSDVRARLPEAQRCPYGAFVEAQDGSGAACVYPVTTLALAGSTLWRACREGSLRGEDLDAHGPRLGFGVGFVHSLAVREDGLMVLGRDEGELRLFDVKRSLVVGELQPRGTARLAHSAGTFLGVAQGRRVHIYVGQSREPSASFELTSPAVALAVHASPPQVLTLTAAGQAETRPLR